MDNDMDSMVITRYEGEPVTRGMLSAAFNKVADKDNWKNPIDFVVHGSELCCKDLFLIAGGIEFFTGSDTYFDAEKDGYVRIKAPGYYATVGA